MLSLFTVLFSVVTASMAAYVMARRTFPGKKLMSALYLCSMFVSIGSVALYPLYKLLSGLGLTKSVIGLALLMTGGQAANIFLVSGFVRGVPKELDEAATIDGAGMFRIFWQIIVPAIKPILGVVALFSFRQAWNEFVSAQVFTIDVYKRQEDISQMTQALATLFRIGLSRGLSLIHISSVRTD